MNADALTLENRLEELFSVVELVDQFCLGPFYLFRDRHIITDDKGATIGYKYLNEIKDKLKDILIRRTKKQVHLQMPERQDKNLLVPMTEEQMAVHDEAKTVVSRLLKKWERMHFLSETDRNRLMLSLQQMRCVCDSTYVLDQKTRYDTKVDEVMNIISNIVESGDEKVVVFSQWERMPALPFTPIATGTGGRWRIVLHRPLQDLESPEATREFVDSLVEVDKETGETNLRIPVPDKESVVQVLGALAKLFTQFGK